MSRFAHDITSTLVDDVLADAGADVATGVQAKILKLVDGITLGPENRRRLVERSKKILFQKLPVPGESRIKRLAQQPVGQAALWTINNPVSRFCLTAGVIVGCAMGIGFSPVVGITTVVTAYAIKTGSAYGMMALKHGIEKVLKRKNSAEKTGAVKKEKFSWQKFRQSFVAAAFGVGQKNPYMNALDIVMTIASGVLLMPTMAQFSHWLGGALSARPAISPRVGIGNAARVAALSEESMVVSAASQSTRQAGLVLSGVGERAYSVASQGTVKFLGGRFAQRYGSMSSDAPTRLAASIAIATAATAMAVGAIKSVSNESANRAIAQTAMQQRMM